MNGVTRDPETGKIHVDLAKLPDIPMDQLLAFDAMMAGMVTSRLPQIGEVYARLDADVSALTQDGESTLRARMANAAAVSREPILPDEQGFTMGVVVAHMQSMNTEMAEIYHEIAQISGSEDVLTQLAKDIQALFHPDTPFTPQEDARPDV